MDKVETSLFLPESMLEELLEAARRGDGSLSLCSQRAWVRARRELTRLALGERHEAAEESRQAYDGQPRRLSVFFPAEMFEELRAEAAYRDCSMSRLVQLAWCLAKGDL